MGLTRLRELFQKAESRNLATVLDIISALLTKFLPALLILMSLFQQHYLLIHAHLYFRTINSLISSLGTVLSAYKGQGCF